MTDRLEVRPAWQTVRRPSPLGPPVALAADDGRCPSCGFEVLEDEPIVCAGLVLDVAPDGTRTVDLSGAEWHCQRCAGTPTAKAA